MEKLDLGLKCGVYRLSRMAGGVSPRLQAIPATQQRTEERSGKLQACMTSSVISVNLDYTRSTSVSGRSGVKTGGLYW